MIGMYANSPVSVSCFHRLSHDEVWHAYAGDPFSLILLHADGRCETVLMGTNPLAGAQVQYVVPAGVWQAGCLAAGGRYALFGCTMAPGFTGGCFEAGVAAELHAAYPAYAPQIQRLAIADGVTRMPQDFAT
jgi:predicted cupin superfamily sugar epimerase